MTAPPKNPSYVEMISEAIKTLKERKGSSRQAISKYIVGQYKLDADKAKSRLRLALKRGVENKVFVQVKGTGASGSFKNAEVPKKVVKVKKPVVKKPKSVKPKAKKPASKAKKAAKSPKKAASKKSPKKTKPAKKPAVKKPAAKKSPAKKPAAKKVKKASAKKATIKAAK